MNHQIHGFHSHAPRFNTYGSWEYFPPTHPWMEKITRKQIIRNRSTHKTTQGQTNSHVRISVSNLFVCFRHFFLTFCIAATQKVKMCHTWPPRVRECEGRTRSEESEEGGGSPPMNRVNKGSSLKRGATYLLKFTSSLFTYSLVLRIKNEVNTKV